MSSITCAIASRSWKAGTIASAWKRHAGGVLRSVAGPSTPQRDYHRSRGRTTRGQRGHRELPGRGASDAAWTPSPRRPQSACTRPSSSTTPRMTARGTRPIGATRGRLIRNGENVGFARACNQARCTRDGAPPRLPQLRLRAGAGLARRTRAVPPTTIPASGAAQAVVLHPDGTVNTAGNRLHYLGFSWAPNGECRPRARRPRSRRARARACSCPHGASARSVDSGRPCSSTARTPTSPGGSAWRGCASSCAPRRASVHDYDFSRHASKHYHLERNRLLMVAANYELSTLARLAPALLAHRARAARRRRARRLAPPEAAGALLRSTVDARGTRAAPRRLAAAADSRQRLLAPPRAEARAGVRGRHGAHQRAAARGLCPPRPPLVGLRAAPPGRLCAHDRARSRRGQPGDGVRKRVLGCELGCERPTCLGLRVTGRGIGE